MIFFRICLVVSVILVVFSTIVPSAQTVSAKWTCSMVAGTAPPADATGVVPPGPYPDVPDCTDTGDSGNFISKVACDEGCNPTCARGYRPACNYTSICKVYGFAVNLVTIGAVILTLCMSLYGSYKYMSAQGEAEALSKARMLIIYAFTGLIIVVISYAIVRTLFSVTGFSDPDSGVAICF